MAASALWQFVRERFPPSSHVPMVTVFALGNVAFVHDLAGGTAAATAAVTAAVTAADLAARFAAVVVLGLSYFFRLRCFDEIKDHAFDLRFNPDRPLARGLVSRRLLGRAVVAALALELALAFGLFGLTGVAVLAVAQGYSLLMYREFFASRWLRPRLTTYAVTHTFSAALLGMALGLLCTEVDPRALGPGGLAMLLFNWFLFNLFEFGRKTWAPAEERPEVDSYSRRFGVVGAVLLGWAQIAVAVVLINLHPRAFARGWAVALELAVLVIPLAGGLALAVRRTPRAGALYRGAVTGYLVLAYAALGARHIGA